MRVPVKPAAMTAASTAGRPWPTCLFCMVFFCLSGRDHRHDSLCHGLHQRDIDSRREIIRGVSRRMHACRLFIIPRTT